MQKIFMSIHGVFVSLKFQGKEGYNTPAPEICHWSRPSLILLWQRNLSKEQRANLKGEIFLFKVAIIYYASRHLARGI